MNICLRCCLAVLLIINLAALSAGCAKKVYPPAPPRHELPVPEKPSEPEVRKDYEQAPGTYTVLGQTYTPLPTARGFQEEGIASWYGPKFHGKKTASGEVFNMYEMTAAHRLLPMHTKVEVTNLENHRKVTLRINDRGPFVNDRVIDLSFAAARKLEMIGPGTAPVRVRAVGSVSRDELPGIFFVQVGSFSNRENALRKQETMKKQGYRDTRLQEYRINGQNFWRVQAGRFYSVGAAEKARDTLASNYSEAFIIAD